MKDRTELGQRLQELREQAELTQLDVAQKVGWSSAQFVSNIERGVAPIPAAKIKKYAQAIKLSTHVLFEWCDKVRSTEDRLAFSDSEGLR